MPNMKKYAKYLVSKFQGDIDFAMKIVKGNAELNLNDADRFEAEVETLQELEVIKASKKSA